eukprot:TRINITY_DN11641_c0_g1::TRINITY_DN11641_c0_g1_i1::g.17477::m.17477 TRINITY_DN11641_c0_g1::TRINITY_DN11641_c0_g1_i1::g.17477  ORF type:complete len:116 (-),score=10.56,DUF4083/PF13314.1/0.53 TRINITY_DN11641_c0_g1_i1:770-1117(-)
MAWLSVMVCGVIVVMVLVLGGVIRVVRGIMRSAPGLVTRYMSVVSEMVSGGCDCTGDRHVESEEDGIEESVKELKECKKAGSGKGWKLVEEAREGGGVLAPYRVIGEEKSVHWGS